MSVKNAAKLLRIGVTKVKQMELQRYQIGSCYYYSRSDVLSLIEAMPSQLVELRMTYDRNARNRANRARNREFR